MQILLPHMFSSIALCDQNMPLLKQHTILSHRMLHSCARSANFDDAKNGKTTAGACIGIISAIVLGAIERVKEIGIMKAMGLKEGEIVRVFLLEAGGIGAIGGLIGCAVGAAMVFWLKEFGVSMEAFFDLGATGVPLADRIHGAWNTFSFFMILVFAVVVAVIASIVPSYWAARKDPIHAIRHR